MNLKPYMSLCILAQVCAAVGAEIMAEAGGREWRLSPECRLEGNILTVTVPKDKAGGMHGAHTAVDLSPFESGGFQTRTDGVNACQNLV